MEDNKKCLIEGCNNKYCARGYCAKHYKQLLKAEGKLTRVRTINKIIIYNSFAAMILTTKSKEEFKTYIDIDDIEKVKKYRWSLCSGYCVTKIDNKEISLQRFIMNSNDTTMDVHHINHNPLDNRKSNLIILTRKQHRFIHTQENEISSINKFISTTKNINVAI